MSHQVMLWLIAWDHELQVLGLLLSLIGVGLSAQAIWETWDLGLQVTRRDHRQILRSHLISHATMLYVQLTFAVISVLVATLPPLPPAMLLPDAQWTLTVVTLRKLLRFGAIVVLMVATVYKRRERRRLLGV